MTPTSKLNYNNNKIIMRILRRYKKVRSLLITGVLLGRWILRWIMEIDNRDNRISLWREGRVVGRRGILVKVYKWRKVLFWITIMMSVRKRIICKHDRIIFSRLTSSHNQIKQPNLTKQQKNNKIDKASSKTPSNE